MLFNASGKKILLYRLEQHFFTKFFGLSPSDLFLIIF